jgi:Flp pilus assembly protein TadB
VARLTASWPRRPTTTPATAVITDASLSSLANAFQDFQTRSVSRMNRPHRLAPRQPTAGPTSTWGQRVLYDCCLALMVIGAVSLVIGLIRTSLALLIVGVLLLASGIEGIAWEMAHRGPQRSSSRDG